MRDQHQHLSSHLEMGCLQVELLLDLCLLPGHLGDHVVSAWSMLDSSGNAFAPPMVVEVTPLDSNANPNHVLCSF